MLLVLRVLLVATSCVAASSSLDLTADMRTTCPHQYWPSVSGYLPLAEGETRYRDIRRNQTHLYYYENYNVTTMNEDVAYRKLIVNVEPCYGTVYVFVRRTWPCFPNPYSCVSVNGRLAGKTCEWTQYHSDISGSRDGAPTMFELNLTSSRFFIAVFATDTAGYTISTLSDVGAMPRPGELGNLTGIQTGELDIQLQWRAAAFQPEAVSAVKNYWVYSTLLLDSDEITNNQVFLKPKKILNTVCGLENTTDSAYILIKPQTCAQVDEGLPLCSANITGVLTRKKYAFNVVAESERGVKRAYSGLVLETNWDTFTSASSENTVTIVGALIGTFVGLLVMGYIWLLKIYS